MLYKELMMDPCGFNEFLSPKAVEAFTNDLEILSLKISMRIIEGEYANISVVDCNFFFNERNVTNMRHFWWM